MLEERRVQRCGEWIGALVESPSYVHDDGEPYRPVAVMWLEVETGVVVDSQLVRPSEVARKAAELFHVATAEPMRSAGEPRIPRRLRVESERLAAALRGQIGDVELVVAPTPEIAPVVASFLEFMVAPGPDDDGPRYLGPGIEPDDVAAFFRAAARLYRARPWEKIPADQYVSVSCELLGPVPGALCVVGQMGQAFGYSLCKSHEDAAAYLAAVERAEREDSPPRLPEHFMVSYDTREEVGPLACRELDEHGWEIAGAGAIPSAMVVNRELVTRGLTKRELAAVTAVTDALAAVAARRSALARAWEQDQQLTWREGGVEIKAPLLLPDLGEAEAVALLDAFAASPEAAAVRIDDAELLCDYAGGYFGCSFAHLDPAELHQLLFEIVPAKVTCEPSAAASIIATARALLAFSARELGSEPARDALASLPADADKQLARELADPRNYGMAKSIMMKGIAEGHDLSTQAGVDAYLQTLRQAPVPRKKPPAKAKRKAQKNARKKSRR